MNIAGVAIKQSVTELEFKLPDRPAQRGLGDIHSARGCTEAARIDDLKKAAERSKLDIHTARLCKHANDDIHGPYRRAASDARAVRHQGVCRQTGRSVRDVDLYFKQRKSQRFAVPVQRERTRHPARQHSVKDEIEGTE